MSAKWRPEGWVNPYKEPYTLKTLEELSDSKNYLAFSAAITMNLEARDKSLHFEAGADAMLEELRKNPLRLEMNGNPLPKSPGGTLVFIPDDKEAS